MCDLLVLYWIGHSNYFSRVRTSYLYSLPPCRRVVVTHTHTHTSHIAALSSSSYTRTTPLSSRVDRYRKRLVRSGMSAFVSPVIFHADTEAGYIAEGDDPRVTWVSCYFFGPDGELLELSSQRRGFAREDSGAHVTHIPTQALWRA